jgi:uroporphyrinogen decarboxylase
MDSMSSRERVLTAFAHQRPDRVPRSAPGLAPAQVDVLYTKTGHRDVGAYFRSDFRGIHFKPPDHLPDFSRYYADMTEPYHISPSGEYPGEWGTATVDAGYYHFSAPRFPLRKLTSLLELEDYPFPDYVRDWDNDHFEAEVKRLHQEGFFVTGWVNRTFQTVWMLTGRDKLFVDAVENPELVTALFDRVEMVNARMVARSAEAGVDAISLSDDIAMKDRMMISPAWYRKWVKPRHAAIIAAGKKVNPKLHVMYHTDGNMMEVIPDLIEVGVTVLSTVQPECIDPFEVKRRFGDQVALGGTIGVQSTMPFENTDEVRRTVKEHIQRLGVGGGFFVSTANTCEPEVPWENIEAMYAAIDEFGAGA